MTAAAAIATPSPRSRELSDYLSPVAVKELRQIVRSGFVSTAFLALLGVEVLAMGIFLTTDALNVHGGDIGRGANLFILLHAILAIIAIAFVPAYTGVRMAMEYGPADLDLMFVTTMNPWSILTGKLLAAMVLTAMLFATCLPFMVLTYLLRGIDIPTIFSVMLVSFLTVAWAVATVLLAGCLRLPTAVRIVIGAGIVGGLIVAAIINIAIAQNAAQRGQATGMASGLFWMETTLALLGNIQCITLLVLLAGVAITPSTANRMLPVRAIMTGAWILAVVPAIAGSALGESMWPTVKWAIWQLVVLSVMLLAAICERRDYGRRLLKNVPEKPLRRFGAFLLWTGWAGGVTWCAILMGATCGILLTCSLIWADDLDDALGIFAILGCLAAHVYAAALLAQAIIGPGRVGRFRQPSMGWLLAIAFFGISWVPIGIILIVIGVAVGSSSHSGSGAAWGAGVTYALLTILPALVLTLGMLRQIRQQFKLFRPIDPSQPPPLPPQWAMPAAAVAPMALPAMSPPPEGISPTQPPPLPNHSPTPPEPPPNG